MLIFTPLSVFLEPEDDFLLLELPLLRPPALPSPNAKTSAGAISRSSSTAKFALEIVRLWDDMMASVYPSPDEIAGLGEYAR